MLKDIKSLPEWHAVCRRYRYNIKLFAIEALGMRPTLQQEQLFASVAQSGSRTTVASGHGCFGIDTPVKMHDGSTKLIQHVRVGDKVMGNNGRSARTVLKLERGRQFLYRFIYGDGTSHVFNEAHILCLVARNSSGNFSKQQKLNVSVGEWLTWPLKKKNKFYIYKRKTASNTYTQHEIIEFHRLGVGRYYGFELDGNSKFLLADGTIVHNTGKTRSAGVIALWHLLFFPESVLMFTAPQIDQLRKLVFKEIAICLACLKSRKLKWLASYITILNESAYIKGYKQTWYIVAKTAPKHQPTNLAGQHGDNYMVWVDEACGVDDAALNVAMGALTHKENRAVMTSQPALPTGFFFDSHHKLAKKNGGVWNALTFNGEESEIVSDEVIKEQILRYGSRTDPGYMIRIRGLFPDLGSEFLITHTMAKTAWQGRSIHAKQHKGYGYVAAVDVGGGTGRDDTVITVARVWGYDDFGDYAKRVDIIEIPFCRNNEDLYDIAGTLKELIRKYPNLSIVVDTTGAGIGLKQHLIREGISFEEVNWGRIPFLEADQKIYCNDRTMAIVLFQRAVKTGRFKILTPFYKTKMEEQMTRLPFRFDEKGRYKIPSKEEMRRQGIASPDIIDTFCFLFLRHVQPIPARSDSFNFANVKAEAIENQQVKLDEEADLMA